MTTMEIPTGSIEAAVASVVMQSFTSEDRETLVHKFVDTVLNSRSHTGARTVLEDEVRKAVADRTGAMVEQVIEEHEGIIKEAILAQLTGEAVQEMVETFVQAITKAAAATWRWR